MYFPDKKRTWKLAKHQGTEEVQRVEVGLGTGSAGGYSSQVSEFGLMVSLKDWLATGCTPYTTHKMMTNVEPQHFMPKAPLSSLCLELWH